MRLPTTLDASTGTVAKRYADATMPPERIDADAAKDPRQLADTLTRVLKGLRYVLASVAQRRPPFRWTNQATSTAGAQFTITHRLGYTPQWRVVGWRNASGGHSLVEVSRDTNTIVLASYVAGTVDLELD